MLPEFITLAVALTAVIAEFVHARRVKRVRVLAFGPTARPGVWTLLAPTIRVLGLSLACWGFLSLWLVVEERIHNTGAIAENDYKHLVLVVDVSPSMHLVDAGATGNQSRRQRAVEVVESLFNRIPLRQFKVTFIAVYTDAKPLIEDSLDHEVVRYIMSDMPMWHAFKHGKTDLMGGISLAAKTAKPWNPGSTYVLMLTDGDAVPATGMPTMPASVAEFLVVGVGDESQGQFIDGHQSRQDASGLRQIANRVRGVYHNGNQKHLTSNLVAKFTESKHQDSIDQWTRREWSLAAAFVGSLLISTLPMLLHYFGTRYRAGTLAKVKSAKNERVIVKKSRTSNNGRLRKNENQVDGLSVFEKTGF